jgi:putative transposase
MSTGCCWGSPTTGWWGTKVAYSAIGVDRDGRKHILDCWIQDSEGARFWHKVVIDVRNRRVRDILIACCEGLTGLPDASRSSFPDTLMYRASEHGFRIALEDTRRSRRLNRLMRPSIVKLALEALALAHRRAEPGPRSATSTPEC